MKLTLTPKLTLIFVLFAAAFLGIVNVLVYNSGQNALETAAIVELESIAGEKQAALNTWFEDKQTDIEVLATDASIIEDVSRLQGTSFSSPKGSVLSNHLLEELQSRVLSREFLSVMLLDSRSGKVVLATDSGSVGKSELDSPYFSEGKIGTYLTPIYYDPELRAESMAVASPIVSEDGQLLGVLAGRINLEELNAIVQRRSGLHQTDDAFLVNAAHEPVTQPRLWSDPDVLQQKIFTVPVNRCLEAKSGSVFSDDYQSEPVIAVYRWLPERKMCLLVKISQTEALANERIFGVQSVWIGLFALLIASVVAVALSHTIIRPLRVMQSAAQRYAEGDLTIRLTEERSDELGALAREFNTMAASLAEKENRLREHSLELERRVEERTAELQHNQKRFQALIENAPDGIALLGLDGRLRQVTPSTHQILGYSIEDAQGQDPGLLTHPDDFPDLLEVLNDLIQNPGKVVRAEYRFQHKDGSWRWLESTISNLIQEPGLEAIVFNYRDITESRQAKEALAESEEKFKYIFDHSVVGKSITHIDGTLEVNQAFCDMLGYSQEGLLDTKWQEITHPEDIELSNRVIELLMSGEKESLRFTKRYLHKDGSIVWGDVNISLRRDQEDKPLYFMTSVVDITERKLAEIKLAESLEFTERILTSAPVGIFTYRLSGQCLSANAAAAQMVGATVEQLKAQNFRELESWKRSGLYDLAEQAIASKQLTADDLHVDTTFGRHAWYRAQFVTFHSAGEELLLMIFNDITERKEAEAALDVSEKRFRSWIENSSDIVTVLDSSGAIQYESPSVRFALGYAPEELLGKKAFDFIHPDDRDNIISLFLNNIQTPDSTMSADFRFRHRDGSWRFLEGIGRAYVDEHDQVAALIHSRDITERKRGEEALRRFELLSANSRDIILFVRSEDSRILDVNQAAINAYGYGREEFLTLTVNHLRAPEAQSSTFDQIAQAEAGGIQFETVHVRKDGSLFPVEVSSQGATIGGVRTLVSIIRDITDRKYSEAALAASEKRFRTWIEHASDILTVTDANGIIQYESPSVKRLLGYEPAELLGKNPFEFVHPEDRDRVVAMFVENIQDPNASVSAEYRFRHKDGSWRSMEALGHIFVDEFDEVVALIHARDITERRNADAALRASEERFRGYFEMSLVGMSITSPAKDFLEVNDQLCTMLGYTREELLQMNWTMISHPDDLDANFAQFNRVLAGDIDSYSLEKRFLRKDGRALYTTMSVNCLRREDGSVDYLMALLEDITDRKRAEEALQEKERLLSEAQQIGQIGSLRYDIAGDRFQFSEEMYRLLDVSPEKFQHNSKDFLSLIYPSDRPDAATWFIDLREGWQVKSLDFRLFRRNGELRYLHCKGALEFNSDGKPFRFIGTTQDVTERKLSEIQINQQIKHLTALSEIDRAIISGLDRRERLEVILSQILSQLQVDAADILLLDSDGHSLRYAAGQGFHTPQMEKIQVGLGNSFAGRVANDRRLLRVPNLEEQVDDPLFDILVTEEKFVSYVGIPLIIMKEVKGVLEVFHRTPFQPYQDWLDFLNTLAGQATIAIENADLLGNLKASNAELSQAYDATIEGWSHAMDLRDKETEGHTQRVVHLTLEMARGLGIPESKLPHIRRGALLHDIGKLGIPDRILLKPDKLTPEEWEIMQKHPEYAYEMLSPIQYLKPALPIPYFHHEKWDGGGYPLGLRGEQIPLEARIFAIVDVWDALRSDRPYRKAWTEERTLEYICSLSGAQFDPTVVDCFMELMKS